MQSGLFVERLAVQNFIAIPAAAFDRELALRLGTMDESLWYTADWDLWLRLGRAGNVRHIRSPLAASRRSRSPATEEGRRGSRVVEA